MLYTVIAIDLKNEPHGGTVWDGSNAQNNWRRAATRAGNAILDINPNLLIVIEGIETCNGQTASAAIYVLGSAASPDAHRPVDISPVSRTYG